MAYDFHKLQRDFYSFEREACLSIWMPKTMDRADAESAEMVSGIATPRTNLIENCIIQTAAATKAARKVNNPIFTLPVRKKVAQIMNVDMGKSAKKITET